MTAPASAFASPLFHAASADAPIAWRRGQLLSAADFLGAIERSMSAFAPGLHVLNLCSDRVNFAILFCATVLSQRVSLQPPNQSPNTIAELRIRYPDLQIVDDSSVATVASGPANGHAAAAATRTIPAIPDSRTAALVFTSGSTGKPTAHPKRWGSLTSNVQAAARRLGFMTGEPLTLVGTVPAQHMYGFESTVLLALFSGQILHGDKPFYPADIIRALGDGPGRKVLVTTPFHLRALLRSGLELPTVQALLCATAPLAPELAREAEHRFSAPLFEIYGCTEAGQIASRRPARETSWQTFGDVRIDETRDDEDQPAWIASGGHIDLPTPLADLLVLESPHRFELVGRGADVVNIAGKRSSLAHLNQLLLGIPGVKDGAFYMPAAAGDVVRLTAFYVSEHLTPAQILAALREHTDPVFLPRPLHRLDALPRAETGKLPQAVLADLAARLR